MTNSLDKSYEGVAIGNFLSTNTVYSTGNSTTTLPIRREILTEKIARRDPVDRLDEHPSRAGYSPHFGAQMHDHMPSDVTMIKSYHPDDGISFDPTAEVEHP